MKKILLLLTTIILYAHNLNLELTNATFLIGGEFKIPNQNIKLRGDFIYNDHENKHNFFSAGIKAEGLLIGAESQNIIFSMLIDVVHTKYNTAIPLGVGVFGYVPNVALPFYFKIEEEYAPEVLSFKDAYRFNRFDMQIGYYPIYNGKIFIGYRNISFNTNYNNSLYAGIGIDF